MNPFSSAVISGNPNQVKLLLDLGCDPNTRGEGGESILHSFGEVDKISKNHIDCIKLLIENGADVHLKDKDGRTPLHVNQDPSVIALLIEAGADVNAQGLNGYTALFLTESLSKLR